MLPDELWSSLLRVRRCPPGGFITSIRLFDCQVIEELLINDRGCVLGGIAPGLAGAHGDIDTSMLTFQTADIEAIQAPVLHVWQQRKWIALNPQHPTRRAWEERRKQ